LKQCYCYRNKTGIT